MKNVLLYVTIVFTISGFAQNKPASNGEVISEKIYNLSELTFKPKYPGGLAALYKHLLSVVQYPDELSGVPLNFELKFVIEKDGTISKPTVNGPENSQIKTQLLQAMATASQWSAGLFDGIPVRTRCVLPISITKQQIAKPDADTSYFVHYVNKNFNPGIIPDSLRSGTYKVWIKITADDEGWISDAIVLKDTSGIFGQRIVAQLSGLPIFKLNPNWKPGSGNTFTFPFTITIDE